MSGPNAPPQQGQQSYRTPKPFLDAVLRRLGAESFVWDLACTTTDCVGVCGGYAFPDVDALAEDWRVHARVEPQLWRWLNPPFGQAKDFARKCAESGARIAALVPVALGTKWWREYVHGRAVVLGVGRLVFDLPDGTRMPAGINRDCALLVYGVTAEDMGTDPSPHAPAEPWYRCEDWRKW
jgi:hypothetical protein